MTQGDEPMTHEDGPATPEGEAMTHGDAPATPATPEDSPATPEDSPATPGDEPATEASESMTHAAGDATPEDAPVTPGDEPATHDSHGDAPADAGGDPTTHEHAPATDAGEPTTPEDAPATPEDAPAAAAGEPMIHEDAPATDAGEPMTPEDAPVTAGGQPATHDSHGDAPAAEPITHEDEPATDAGEPTTPEDAPATHKDAAAAVPQETAAPAPVPLPPEKPAPLPAPPRTGPVPTPAALARIAPHVPAPAAVTPPDAPDAALAARARAYGRVDDDGSVYVRTSEGERQVGSWQPGQPEAALAFYARRHEALVVEADLLERRLRAGASAPDDTAKALRRLAESLGSAQAVGDLDGLAARLAALDSVVEEQRAVRREERARVIEEGRAAKTLLVEQAESVAAGTDWRAGVETMRRLLDTWKSLPRLDRAADDELWHRFSAARTSYTRRRKAHFAEQGGRRDEAKTIKERLVADAEELSSSTEWSPTASRFRDLMAQWKAAGATWRTDEEALWSRFRTAQDAFFVARSATFAKRDDAESTATTVKESLLREAKSLLPVSDLKAAKAALRSIQDRWLAAGRVSKEAVARLEGGLRTVEEAIRSTEQNEWKRTNPEARARAESTVVKLQQSINALETARAAAEARSDSKATEEAAAAIEARRSWLETAQATLDEFRR